MVRRLIAGISKMYYAQLSKNLSYEEATNSMYAKRNGLDNTPNFRQLGVMKYLAINLFQVIRDYFDSPIIVSSFYRAEEVNKGVGGSSKSDHMIKGNVAAIDIDNDNIEAETGVSNRDIFYFIYDNLDYYKLIWEYGDNNKPSWVHVSYSKDERKNQEKRTYRIRRDGAGNVITEQFKDRRL